MPSRLHVGGIRKGLLRAGVLLLFAALIGPQAHACVALAASSIGVAQQPIIAGEQSVIIWDEAHKIEHFIREANINTSSPDLAFLVPTPQIPEVVEVDPAIFQMAAEVAAPKITPLVNHHNPMSIASASVARPIQLIMGYEPTVSYRSINTYLPGPSTAPHSAQVVSTQDSPNYSVTTLEAADPEALGKWLKDNGFTWNDKAAEWLKPYIANKWKITAFKLINQNNRSYSTHAIRMSFPTDRPFYPYSEPGDVASGGTPNSIGRTLRVAFLSNARMNGKLDDGHDWPGQIQFSGSTTPENTITQNWKADQWLTLAKLRDSKYETLLPSNFSYFLDSSNPRPGTADLFFSPSSDPSPMRQIAYSSPAQNVIDFRRPLPDLAAALIIALIPVAAFRTGLRTFNRQKSEASPNPKTPSLPVRAFDRILAIVAIAAGMLHTICYGYLMAVFFYYATSGKDPYNLKAYVAGIILSFWVVAMAVSLLYCGMTLYRRSPASQAAPLEPATPPKPNQWDHVMGLGSLCGGFAFVVIILITIHSALAG